MSNIPLRPIRLERTAAENMLDIINAVAIEPMTYADFDLGKPMPHQDTNPFYNTSVVLTAKGNKFRGSDTQYYHRVDVGNKGVADTDGTKYIGKAIRVEQSTPQGILQDICTVLGLKHTEFTLSSVANNPKYNYKLTAKVDSWLYIKSICVKVENKPIGDLVDLVEGFYPPERSYQYNASGTLSEPIGTYTVVP